MREDFARGAFERIEARVREADKAHVLHLERLLPMRSVINCQRRSPPVL